MKIEEPKTPYNYMDNSIHGLDQLDAEVLAEKLQVAATARTSSFSSEDDSDEDTEPETEEQKGERPTPWHSILSAPFYFFLSTSSTLYQIKKNRLGFLEKFVCF